MHSNYNSNSNLSARVHVDAAAARQVVLCGFSDPCGGPTCVVRPGVLLEHQGVRLGFHGVWFRAAELGDWSDQMYAFIEMCTIF